MENTETGLGKTRGINRTPPVHDRLTRPLCRIEARTANLGVSGQPFFSLPLGKVTVPSCLTTHKKTFFLICQVISLILEYSLRYTYKIIVY